MKTKLHYLYRDNSNYKTVNTAILDGEMTETDYEHIKDCLFDGEYFLPSQVDLENTRNWDWNEEDDNPWFELIGFECIPDTTSITPIMSVTELIQKFDAARGKWDTDEYPYG